MEERYFGLLEEADRDPSVRAIVVTGSAEGKTFCPGLDMQRLSAQSTASDKLDVSARRPQTFPLRIRKPMIAAINGACAGVGLMQALNCDVRFAAANHEVRRVQQNLQALTSQLGQASGY